MLSLPQCSKVAFESLQAGGLPQRLESVLPTVREMLLYRTPYVGEGAALIESIENANSAAEAMSSDARKDILLLCKELEGDDLALDFARVKLPNHPYFLSILALGGSELQRFSSWGFTSEYEFAQAVNAYCLGEFECSTDKPDLHHWRCGERKSKLELMTHGDVSFLQANVGGGVICTPSWSGFTLYQDCSPLLAMALHYARHLGLEAMPELVNWQELVAKYDAKTPWGAGLRRWKEQGSTIGQLPLLSLLDDYKLLGASGDASGAFRIELRQDAKWPALEQGELIIYSPREGGPTEVHPWGPKGLALQVEEIMRLSPADLPDLLTGIYKTYARNRMEMCALLSHFTKQR